MSKTDRYYRWHPADAAILERLPIEGSVIGYQVLAATVARLRETLNRDVPAEGQLTSDQLQSRLRSMHVAGYVVNIPVMGAKSRMGWQRTRKGELLYAEHTGRALGPTIERSHHGHQQEA